MIHAVLLLVAALIAGAAIGLAVATLRARS